MDERRDNEFVSSITPHVMRCLEQRGFLNKLDDLLSPRDSQQPQSCDGTYKLSESILLSSGFVWKRTSGDIFAVLHSKGACCDCEVLYDVAAHRRLKANYWRARAAEQSVGGNAANDQRTPEDQS